METSDWTNSRTLLQRMSSVSKYKQSLGFVLIQIIFVNELSESRDIWEDVVAGTAGCRREQTRSWDRDIYHLELLSTEEEGERGAQWTLYKDIPRAFIANPCI